MGKVVVNGKEFTGFTDVVVKCGRVELYRNGECDGYLNVENPLVIFQYGSANKIHAVESAYIKSGKINNIESREVVFDRPNQFTLACKYKKEFEIPDIDALLSSNKGMFTPVICSGKFNEIHSLVLYPNMCRLSCAILNTRGIVGLVTSSNIAITRVLPLSNLACLAAYSATF